MSGYDCNPLEYYGCPYVCVRIPICIVCVCDDNRLVESVDTYYILILSQLENKPPRDNTGKYVYLNVTPSKLQKKKKINLVRFNHRIATLIAINQHKNKHHIRMSCNSSHM